MYFQKIFEFVPFWGCYSYVKKIIMAKPIYIKVEKTFNHPKSKVWETVAVNFDGVSNYSPGVAKSNFIGEKKECIGTARHCDFPKKGWIEEQIIEWNEGVDFKVEKTASSMPMKFMESKFIFEDAGEGKTKMTQEFWYRMGGPMGFLSGMMKGKMTKMLNNGMEGLDKYLTHN